MIFEGVIKVNLSLVDGFIVMGDLVPSMSSCNHYKITVEEDADEELIGLLHWHLNSEFYGHVERDGDVFVAKGSPRAGTAFTRSPKVSRNLQAEMKEVMVRWGVNSWVYDCMDSISNSVVEDMQYEELVDEILRKSSSDTSCSTVIYRVYDGENWCTEELERFDEYRLKNYFDTN